MRPLVILHGLFGSSRNWKSVSKILSGLSENRDIRAIDLRNHNFYYGASRINGPMDSWEILHRDLENYWEKELNSEEFDILGHSFVFLNFVSMEFIIAFYLGRSDCNDVASTKGLSIEKFR